MAELNFQPEQRVTLIAATDRDAEQGLRNGMSGTVDACEYTVALVSWDNWRRGHGICHDEWYVNVEQLELIP